MSTVVRAKIAEVARLVKLMASGWKLFVVGMFAKRIPQLLSILSGMQ